MKFEDIDKRDIFANETGAVYGGKTMNNCRVTIINQNEDLAAIAEGMYYAKRKFSRE